MRWLVLGVVLGCGQPHGMIGDASPTGDGLGDGLADGPPDGVPIPSCPSGTWCQETATIANTTILAAVWAVNAGDVFAVGDAGTIIRRHNNAWGVMTSNTTQNLRGVWAASSSDAWAVGSAGTIVRFDGTTWSPVIGATTSDLTAVWGASANDVWMVGPNTALHWNGSTYTTTGLGGVVLGVSGTATADVWTAGESAYVRHFTGTWSSPISPISGNATYYAVVAEATEVWVTTAIPTMETVRWNGATWTSHTTGNAFFQALYAGAPTNVWGVGQTKVGQWNGSTWTVGTPPGVTLSLYGVTGAGTDVFVVGAGAMILHRD